MQKPLKCFKTTALLILLANASSWKHQNPRKLGRVRGGCATVHNTLTQQKILDPGTLTSLILADLTFEQRSKVRSVHHRNMTHAFHRSVFQKQSSETTPPPAWKSPGSGAQGRKAPPPPPLLAAAAGFSPPLRPERLCCALWRTPLLQQQRTVIPNVRLNQDVSSFVQ